MAALAVPNVARADTVRLDGSPLDVFVDGLGDLQVRYDGQGTGEFYGDANDVGDAGFALRTAAGASLPFSGRTPVDPPKLTGPEDGTRTVTSTYDVTVYNSDRNPDATLRVAESVAYTDGTSDVRLHLLITNPGTAPVSFAAGEVADLYAGGDDDGTGVYRPDAPRFVGGTGPSGGADGLVEVPGSEWSHFEQGGFETVFDDFSAGTMTDKVQTESVDDGVGVEWAVDSLAPKASKSIDAVWRFGARRIVTVNTLADHDDGSCDDKDCTLREAIADAPDGATVYVPAGTYKLTGKELAVTDKTLSVVGAGAGGTTIDGQGASRVLHVLSGTLQLSGVRLTGGNGRPGNDRRAFAVPDGSGGALAIESGAGVTVVDSQIENSTAGDLGGGVGSYGTLELVRSTIAHNKALGGEGPPHGGGLFTGDTGDATLVDSTVGDNHADGGTGGGIAFEGPLTLLNTTIAGNSAESGGGIERIQTPSITAANTIVAGNLPQGSECAGSAEGTIETSHDLIDDLTCPHAGQGDLAGKDALLGPLGNHGGQTDTYVPGDGSPAIDGGDGDACFDSRLENVDQRGEARDQGLECDIGSVEQAGPEQVVDPPVIASPADGSTVNTSSITFRGTAMPGADVSVFEEGQDAGGEGVADDSGAWSVNVPPLPDGTYRFRAVACKNACSDQSAPVTVSIDTADPPAPAIVTAPTTSGSTVALSGTADPGSTIDVFDNGTRVATTDAPDGTWSVTLTGVAPGQHRYTAVARDAAGNSSPASPPRDVVVAQPQQATPTPTPTPTATPASLPPPVEGKAVNAQTKSGTVKVKLPGTNTFVELGPGQQVPNGTIIDTTHGRITLTSAVGGGKTEHADFYQGIFKVTQTGGRKPLTQLTLAGPKPTCTTHGRKAHASAARKGKKKVKTRSLWGSGHGAFRTKGQYSSATVRGTTWLTQDSCAGTLTRVTSGVVQVQDFVRHKKVLVRAGHRYLARAKRH